MTPAEVRPLGPALPAPCTVPSQHAVCLSLFNVLFMSVCAASASPAGLRAPCGPSCVCLVCLCVLGAFFGFAFQPGSTPRQETGSPRSTLPSPLGTPACQGRGVFRTGLAPPQWSLHARTCWLESIQGRAAVALDAPPAPQAPEPFRHSPGLVAPSRALLSIQARKAA